MNINLLTDAPKHNLALMQISTYHKAQGDKVWLNGVGQFDYTYGSWLFDFSQKGICNEEGGPAIDPIKRNNFENLKPDYDLYGLDFSLGFTWHYCPRKCSFCKVPKQNNPKTHKSIWTFHNSNFKKICLMNNNTFSDPQWKETFQEIWDANLTVIDENGYDLRLIDDEKAQALKNTKFLSRIHFAWDQMKDTDKILSGLEILKKNKTIKSKDIVYLLIGYDTTEEEDIYRAQKINEFGLSIYPMPFVKNNYTRAFRDFIRLYYWRKYKDFKEAWKDCKRRKLP